MIWILWSFIIYLVRCFVFSEKLCERLSQEGVRNPLADIH